LRLHLDPNQPVAAVAVREPLWCRFGAQAFCEARQIDDHALMRAGADLFGLICGADGELDAAAVNFRHLGLADDPLPDRGRRQMPHLDPRPDRALPRVEIGFDRVKRAFSITMIMTGVANTGGSAVSLN
jgi:hypothetical protein